MQRHGEKVVETPASPYATPGCKQGCPVVALHDVLMMG